MFGDSGARQTGLSSGAALADVHLRSGTALLGVLACAQGADTGSDDYRYLALSGSSPRFAAPPMAWITKKLVLWVLGGATGLLGASMAAQGVLSQQSPANLGLVDGKLRPCPPGSRNCVCSEANETDRHVPAFDLQQVDSTSLYRIAGVIQGMPRARVVTRDEHYLRAEFTSLVFRFVDDLELRLDRDAARVHVRSASRVGKGDLGVNKKRVDDLRERLRSAGILR